MTAGNHHADDRFRRGKPLCGGDEGRDSIRSIRARGSWICRIDCRRRTFAAGRSRWPRRRRWFPPGTIHVAVVDPGVGSKRRIVYAQIGSQQFVAPDNGLLSRLAERERAV